VQIILSTAHPAKFHDAVELALRPFSSPAFNFERDVLPAEFIGLLGKRKRVIEVEKPDKALVKGAMEDVLNSTSELDEEEAVSNR
jgi:threonine synthase